MTAGATPLPGRRSNRSLERLAQWTRVRTRTVLLIGMLVLAGGIVLGSHATSRLQDGGLVPNNAPSSQAASILDRDFGGQANLVFLITARHGSIAGPAVTNAANRLAQSLRQQPHVRVMATSWDSRGGRLRSRSGRQGLILASVGGDNQEALTRTKDLVSVYTGERQPSRSTISVAAGGTEGTNAAISDQLNRDLRRAELIALPITLVLLVIVFGSVMAAVLPVAMGLLSIIATLAILDLLAQVTPVSIYALNLTTLLGLGLSIDYALLMVSRYREELRRGRSPADAVTTTVQTAGKTIAYSGATVAATLAVLTVFPLYFLRSFAYAGVAVIVVSVICALVLLPALLIVLGRRVDSGMRAGRFAGTASGEPSRRWRGIAKLATAHPWPIALGGGTLLLMLAVPFARVEFASPDSNVLPYANPARQVSEALTSNFVNDPGDQVDAIIPTVAHPTVQRLSAALSRLPRVTDVASSAGTWQSGVRTGPPPAGIFDHHGPDYSHIEMGTDASPETAVATHLVRQILATKVEGISPLVAGPAAQLVDQDNALAARLPLALVLIIIVSYVLLFLFTKSMVLPVKAIVLNVLSLLAVFGVVVWIFQEGYLAGLLNVTPGPISTPILVLMFSVILGLSMDYEVFVLSRIKEHHDRGNPNRESIIEGLSRTGAIVSTAAALLAVTFFAFGTSGVGFIKMFGIGTGIAVLLDATVVRGLLVPASMRLTGEANWWRPPPLPWRGYLANRFKRPRPIRLDARDAP